MENFEQQIAYWKAQFETAMLLLDKQQKLMQETSQQIRELEKQLYGGSTK
jgi:hypothetical protein